MSQDDKMNILQGYINSETRVEKMRKLNRLKQVQDEDAREEAMLRSDMARRNYQKQLTREEAIAAELEARKQKLMRREKVTQLVREQAPELRELEQKLQAAYTTKERENQVAEARVAKENERRLELLQHEETERLREQQELAAREQDAIRRETLAQQKVVLEQQMKEREDAELIAYQQYLEEKKLVDAVVAKIELEDRKEREEKLQKQHQTQDYINKYLEDRAVFQQHEEERRKAEDEEIVRYMKVQAQRKEDNLRAAKEKEMAQQKRLEEQSKAIAAERQRKQEMEDLIADYHLEVVEKKERERAREELESKLRARLRMLEENEAQKKLKVLKKEEEAEEELLFRQKMMEKFADDDRLEQMKLAERNRKRAEHNREVDRIMQERKAQREIERQRMLDLHAQEEEKEDARRRIIQEERLKLLRQHALVLGKKYLPKGVFTPEDLQHLGIESLDELP